MISLLVSRFENKRAHGYAVVASRAIYISKTNRDLTNKYARG